MGKLVFAMMQSLDGYGEGEIDVAGPSLAASDRVGEDAVRLTCVPA